MRTPAPQMSLDLDGQSFQPEEDLLPAAARVDAASKGPRVLNTYSGKATPGSVYIGRPSKWGNPFAIGRDGDRAAVIERYRGWLLKQPGLMAEARRELKGCDLVCFCAPQACHGDVLLAVANGPAPEATDSPPISPSVRGQKP